MASVQILTTAVEQLSSSSPCTCHSQHTCKRQETCFAPTHVIARTTAPKVLHMQPPQYLPSNLHAVDTFQRSHKFRSAQFHNQCSALVHTIIAEHLTALKAGVISRLILLFATLTGCACKFKCVQLLGCSLLERVCKAH